MMANIECWLGSFVIFQGIRTSIGRKHYIFVIFQGGGLKTDIYYENRKRKEFGIL